MLSNQPAVNSNDQYVWRHQYDQIHSRIRRISALLHCDFLNFNQLIGSIAKTKSDRVLTILSGDLILEISIWRDLDKICQAAGKKLWVVTNNLINHNRHSFDNVRITSYPQLLGMYLRDNQPNVLPSPTRLYNCFMQRCESVRQSWFYFLWLEELLDKGYVSYLLYQLDYYSKLTSVELFDLIHYNKGLDQLEKFQQAYQALRSKVPYKNFDENFNLNTYIDDSKYSVILETYATDDDRDQWCFTEKTMRSLQSNSINLIFAQKRSIKRLEGLGLEIDPINRQWDNDDWIIRQRKILEVLKTDSVPSDMILQKHRGDYNRSILHSWLNEYQKPDFFDSLIEEIKSS